MGRHTASESRSSLDQSSTLFVTVDLSACLSSKRQAIDEKIIEAKRLECLDYKRAGRLTERKCFGSMLNGTEQDTAFFGQFCTRQQVTIALQMM